MPLLDRVRVHEQSSKTVTFTLLDPAGVAVPLANISTAQLTLLDLDTYVPGASPTVGIINSREGQDIRNAHNVTIHSTSGLVTWEMQPGDNPIVTLHRQIERHRAEFRFVTTASAELNYPIEIEVVNLRKAG